MNDSLKKIEEVDAEVIETDDEDALLIRETGQPQRVAPEIHERNVHYLHYVLLPFVFLTVAMLGGVRISGLDGAFVFVRPALVCLIFAAILLVLFARSRVLELDGWFSESYPMTKNVANAFVIATLFCAATQVFNSLIPEQGLAFWIVAFCFFWTLWNNLFTDFDTQKLFRSLGALFALAFLSKYLLLANLTAPAGRTWFEALMENPGQEAVTRLLDLPRFSGATGYIQFFAVALFLLGLYLFPPRTDRDQDSIR